MLLVAGGSSLLTAAACQLLFGIDEDSLRGPSGGSAGIGGSGGSAGIGGSAAGGTSGTDGSAGTNGRSGSAGSSGKGGTGGTLNCENDKVACGADCRNVLGNDADNCGACDRSCGGSTCKAGLCEPQVVVTGEVAPYALAQSNDSLFWVSPARKQDGSGSPRVRSLAKGTLGGIAQNLFTDTFVRARSLAFFDNVLYHGTLGNDPSDTSGQRLARGAPADDGVIPVAPGQLNIQHLAVSPSNHVYWTSLNDSAVRGTVVTGGSIEPEILSQGTVGWVTVDRDNQDQVYWVRSDTKQVRRQVLGSSNPTNAFELVATANAPVSVELGNDRVYWADRVPGTIQSAPKADLAAVTVEFQNQGTVEGFALAGTSLVVITLADDGQGTKVFKVWRKNEGREPFLLGQVPIIDPTVTYANGNPFGAAHVLVDETFVYFADVGTLVGKSVGVDLSLGDGIIYRVAK